MLHCAVWGRIGVVLCGAAGWRFVLLDAPHSKSLLIAVFQKRSGSEGCFAFKEPLEHPNSNGFRGTKNHQQAGKQAVTSSTTQHHTTSSYTTQHNTSTSKAHTNCTIQQHTAQDEIDHHQKIPETTQHLTTSQTPKNSTQHRATSSSTTQQPTHAHTQDARKTHLLPQCRVGQRPGTSLTPHNTP